MYTTAYKPRNIRSPFQSTRQVQKKSYVPQVVDHPVHPVREELNKILKTYQLEAEVKEDTETLSTMKHIGGMIAILCVLKREGKILSIGRGATVLGPNNKWLTRAVESAFNSALSDAVIRSTKVLGTFLSPSGSAVSLEEAYSAIETQKNGEPATPKQISYLRTLIQTNVEDDQERDQWESQLHEMSKREAGLAIEKFVG